MWIFLPSGFVSIVHKDCPPHHVMVRARSRAHLSAFFEPLPSRERRSYQERVRAHEGTDYQFRVSAPRATVKRLLAAHVDVLDYSNFKDEAARVSPTLTSPHGGRWMGALHDVWSAVWEAFRGT